MNNTTANSKCSNLGIVMECAEISEENHERQALLMGESNKSPVATQSLDKMKKDESEETPKTQPDKTVSFFVNSALIYLGKLGNWAFPELPRPLAEQF
jgi:hypothetical protein